MTPPPTILRGKERAAEADHRMMERLETISVRVERGADGLVPAGADRDFVVQNSLAVIAELAVGAPCGICGCYPCTWRGEVTTAR